MLRACLSKNPIKSGSAKTGVVRSPLWRGARKAFIKRRWKQSKEGPDWLQIKA